MEYMIKISNVQGNDSVTLKSNFTISISEIYTTESESNKKSALDKAK